MSEKHTSGPWAVYQLAFDTDTYGDKAGSWIVTANNDDDEVCGVIPKLEDAKLIAAAPELLDALRKLLIEFNQHVPEDLDCPQIQVAADEARAAIAKAEGK